MKVCVEVRDFPAFRCAIPYSPKLENEASLSELIELALGEALEAIRAAKPKAAA